MTAVRTEAQTPAPLSAHAKAYWGRIRGGEMGALPAVLGIVVLVAGFGIARPVFLTPGNFANLLPQSAQYTLIAMGLVFVLLLGEIDLSAGFTSGLCAALMSSVMAGQGVPWYYALALGIASGAVIGLVLGSLVAKVGIPSFVVTLAAFLAFQGLLLLVVKEGQIITIQDPVILWINNSLLPVWLGWVLFAATAVGYAAIQLGRRANRRKRGLVSDAMSIIAVRTAMIVVLGGAAVYVLSIERSRVPERVSLRGVPVVVLIVLILLIALTFVLRRTRYGLHLYAVGGNPEAARRAGIATARVRISAFVICSTLAAVGGIVAASRDNSVSPTSGGSDVLLYAVGAAVIGGTSLFGGRGRVLDAVLGGAVVTIIANGMGLLGSKSWLKYVVTGSVLLVAAGVDALSRRRSAATGPR